MSRGRHVAPPNIGPRTGICGCGCGSRTTIARKTSTRDNTVKGQPNLYVNVGHAATKSHAEYLEASDGCWIWQRSTNPKGYGKVSDGRQAHRAYYETAYGPIPAGMHLHHLCGAPSCVNPAHLQPVPNREHGAGTIPVAIRRLHAGGVAVDVLAAAFGWTVDRVERSLTHA